MSTAQGYASPPVEYRPNLAVRFMCPDCKNPQPNLIEEYSSGDIVCGDCGLVLGDRVVDTRSEWRVRDHFISPPFLMISFSPLD